MTLADIPFNLTLPRWEVWMAPLAGLLSAGLALVMGHLLLARRRVRRPATRPTVAANDPFNLGSACERRRTLRRKGKPIRLLVSDADARAEAEEAWVVDRSMGGLCFSFARDFPAGTILSVRAQEAPSTIGWVQVEVRSTRHGPDGWEIGCKFVRTPPWGVLLTFG